MKTAFIGCGNMASAIIGGILSSGISVPGDLMASDSSPAAQERIRNRLKIACVTNMEAASGADILFLSVKPQYYEEVIEEIRDAVRQETVIVTIAPGKTLSWLREQFGRDLKIVRTMPNTPAMVGAGITAATPNANVTDDELAYVRRILGGFGISEVIGENLMDAVVSVSGSSPAYVFMFIEAMADAAVADGMPRAQAYRFAAQAVMGSAKMVLETGKHPGELKDMVCSPAGTTIEAVRVLEEKGLRSAVIEAMQACTERSRSLGK